MPTGLVMVVLQLLQQPMDLRALLLHPMVTSISAQREWSYNIPFFGLWVAHIQLLPPYMQ